MAQEMSDAPQPPTDPTVPTAEQDRLVQSPTPSQLRQASSRRLRFGTKALVQSRDRVLLVRERRADGTTFWTLPGGGIDPGETPRESLARELREEISCECSLGAIVARCQYDHTTRSNTTSLYSVFETTLDGEPVPNVDEGIVECGWVDPAEVPGDTLDPIASLLEP